MWWRHTELRVTPGAPEPLNDGLAIPGASLGVLTLRFPKVPPGTLHLTTGSPCNTITSRCGMSVTHDEYLLSKPAHLGRTVWGNKSHDNKATGPSAKMPFGVPTSHVGAPGLESQLFLAPALRSCAPWEIAQVLESLPPLWETQTEILAPSFSLLQPWLLGTLRE